MTRLQRRALLTLPLSEATVESFYDGTRSGSAEACLKALCESHERLRAEAKGAEILLESLQSEVASVLTQLDELASSWGDEGVFRRCRDRLRALTPSPEPARPAESEERE